VSIESYSQCTIKKSGDDNFAVFQTQNEQVYTNKGKNNNGDYRYGVISYWIRAEKSLETIGSSSIVNYSIALRVGANIKHAVKPRRLLITLSDDTGFVLDCKEIRELSFDAKSSVGYEATYILPDIYYKKLCNKKIKFIRSIDTWKGSEGFNIPMYESAIMHLLMCVK
jgi:hypothetical protein